MNLRHLLAKKGKSQATTAKDIELTLPPQEAAFVKQTYASANNILEYGSGGSTIVAAQMGKHVVAVESDARWAENMNMILRSEGLEGHARVVHADIGPTTDWGKPKNSAGFGTYHHYPMAIWDDPALQHPDVVLIDGRFRVACFCSVVLRCRKPTRVLFDDYADRPYYHSVEGLVQPTETIARMAVFDVKPGLETTKHLTWMLGSFVEYG